MQEIRPRKPIVATLMSAFLPGFGQLYNGEVNRAIWLYIVFLFINVPWLALLALYFSGGLLVPMLLLTFIGAISVWVFGMVDAWRHARSRQDYVPDRWQSSGLYVLVFIVCNVIVLPALTMYVRSNHVEPFRIPTVSMEPSVLRGDFLFADKRYNCPNCKYRIERGDIAVFAEPNDRTRLSIKRIIALPGDHVVMDGRSVSINGNALSSAAPLTSGEARAGVTEITERTADGRQWTVQWGPTMATGPNVDVTVPPGEVFVLGDNRSNSRDSRYWGTVPMHDVVGRAHQVWFSLGSDGIRWSRLERSTPARPAPRYR